MRNPRESVVSAAYSYLRMFAEVTVKRPSGHRPPPFHCFSTVSYKLEDRPALSLIEGYLVRDFQQKVVFLPSTEQGSNALSVVDGSGNNAENCNAESQRQRVAGTVRIHPQCGKCANLGQSPC